MANGRLNNCYCLKDFVLKYIFMKMMSKYEPIGIKPMFEELSSEEGNSSTNS